MTARPTTNTNYKVIITGPDGRFEAWLPETFDLRLQSDWEPLLMNSLDGATGSIKDIMAGAFGAYPFLQAITGQVWRGTGPIEFNLALQLDAENDAYTDVTAPIMQLTKWSTPYVTGSWAGKTGGILHAPGPTLVKAALEGPMYTLAIGNFLVIPNVIFPSLDITWHTAPVATGDFIAADINLAVRTFYVPTREDIIGWFKTGGGGNNWLYE